MARKLVSVTAKSLAITNHERRRAKREIENASLDTLAPEIGAELTLARHSWARQRQRMRKCSAGA
eukprot:6725878-Pyramimonas_sp.AAC.1